MRIIPLDQNSDAWLEWRHSGIGSSDAPAVFNLSPWKTRRELWEEKVYRYHKEKAVLSGKQLALIAEKLRENENRNLSSKNRGKSLEPVAREEYERWLGFEVPPVCGVHDIHEFLKVSLDGWNPDRKLFVEIKAPNQKAHQDAISGIVPDYYVPQVLHQFVTSDAKECHYISYHDKFPPGQRLSIVQVNTKTAREALGIAADLADMLAWAREELCKFWKSVIDGEYREMENGSE